MVSLSSRISPFTSTVIFLERSPRATAVVTSAMFLTWPVRFAAIEFTLSVRSFHTPPTPFTCAWPPSLPSVPTSFATRDTSPAKALSWSTMVLIVLFSSRISPRTSTVIFLERSPRATAVVTSAMLRTWPVRFAAIELTLSVRSFHTPATPGTCAWPPSLPSVPTSRATRDTSPAKALSCPTIVFTTVPRRSASPRSGRPSTSSTMVCERSPFATEPITRATSLTGYTMSPISVLIDWTTSVHEPAAPGRLMRVPVWPSLPTCSAMRAISAAFASSSSTQSLNACAISPSMPVRLSGMRTEKSPRRKDLSAFSSSPRSSIICRPAWIDSMVSPALKK